MGYTVEEYEARVAVSEYMAECVHVETFLAFCRECASYGTIWSCPPFDFSPEAIWQAHETFLIRGRKILTDGAVKPEIHKILAQEKRQLLDELLLLEKEYPGSAALSAGNCRECLSCAKIEGAPCRKPDRMRYSIEALGGDVSRTASRWLGQEIRWIKDGKLPEYLMLVGGLLI